MGESWTDSRSSASLTPARSMVKAKKPPCHILSIGSQEGSPNRLSTVKCEKADRLAQDFGEVERLAAAAVCGIAKTADGRMEVTAEAQRRKSRELIMLRDAALAAAEALVKGHRSAITNV